MAGKIRTNGAPPQGLAQLVVDEQHYEQVVLAGMLRAKVSIAIATADFKAMLTPMPGSRQRRADSIVRHLARLAERGVEVRLLHAGVPSSAALHELRAGLPAGMTIRRCPRLHAKTIIVDAKQVYLGSANLTGAGLGAKSATRRNIEWGLWSESAELVDGTLQQFNALWEGSRCEGCGRRDICPEPLEEPRLTQR